MNNDVSLPTRRLGKTGLEVTTLGVGCAWLGRRADGSIYHRFKSLWIATEQDGHWGIQFRSSYLGG